MLGTEAEKKEKLRFFWVIPADRLSDLAVFCEGLWWGQGSWHLVKVAPAPPICFSITRGEPAFLRMDTSPGDWPAQWHVRLPPKQRVRPFDQKEPVWLLLYHRFLSIRFSAMFVFVFVLTNTCGYILTYQSPLSWGSLPGDFHIIISLYTVDLIIYLSSEGNRDKQELCRMPEVSEFSYLAESQRQVRAFKAN